MFNKKKKNNKGFTLVELLVVIAIIGILAVVAVPSLFKNINKAKVADVVAYVNAVKTEAMSQYADEDGSSADTIDADSIKLALDGTEPEDVTLNKVVVNDGKVSIEITVPEEIEADVKDKMEGKDVTVNKPAEPQP